MINIELLTKENFNENSLDYFERRQEVRRVYRKSENGHELVELPYIEDWDIEKKRQVAKDISSTDYISYIATDGSTVIGFIGLIKQLNNRYMILDLMQVSAAYRGKGIGGKLFSIAKEEAAKAGANALYISACSSEETIAFYKAMGAEHANPTIPEIAENEPFDLQLMCII
ncbi:MAG: GNAT family N-acetyltransferase [Oscillospiraceae bacterium]